VEGTLSGTGNYQYCGEVQGGLPHWIHISQLEGVTPPSDTRQKSAQVDDPDEHLLIKYQQKCKLQPCKQALMTLLLIT